MRKVQKKQAEELLCLIGQMHEEIRKELEAGRADTASACLGECQETALRLGELIEQSEGEGHVTITLLEAYCELVYQLYKEIHQGQQFHVRKAYKKLKKALNQIENSMKNEIRLHKEVVFLPYKAAMWDSLESVWKAADADPDCDAYVIPIPYFDRKPDGSFGEEHYEGNLYPDDVPVTHWQEYDFEHRRPDMIFIHNPYDEYNLVTSVHSFFYSKNLKKYTEQLVYIPYFILNEIDPSDKEAVKGIEDLCVVSAVIHADKVIVQSEAMRQIYIDLMQENMGTDKIPGAYWENKILGLGSPKVDKVLNTRREELKIPEEWLRIIQKEDGSWKKVIFYNTGIAALLRYEDRWLLKIEQALQKFRENKDKVTLLWRPHPLLETTMKSMRPEILQKYLSLKDNFKKESWGIYDDSPNLHRAIVWSDAYFGDGSSVTALYAVTRKPVMFQNVAVSNNKEEKLIFENLLDDGERFWFSSMNFNSLWMMDKTNFKTKHVGFFPNEEGCKWRQFCSAVKTGDQLFFIPVTANGIAVYSIASGQFSTIKIPECRCLLERKVKFNSESKFIDGFVYGDNLYIIPNTYPGILKYNVRTGNIKVLDEWIPELDQLIKTSDAFGYFSHGIANQNRLMLACTEADALLEFDMSRDSYLIHKLDSGNLGYHGICFDGENYWMSPVQGGNVVKWNMSAGILAELDVLGADEENLLFPFTNIVYCGGYIWLLPLYGSRAVKILAATNQVTTADEFQNETDIPQLIDGIDPRMCFVLQKSNDESVYAYSLKSCALFKYDLNNDRCIKQSVTVNIDDFGKTCAEFMANCAAQVKTGTRHCFYEGASVFLTLDAYLHFIINHKEDSMVKREEANIPDLTGKAIYTCIKNEVLLT